MEAPSQLELPQGLAGRGCVHSNYVLGWLDLLRSQTRIGWFDNQPVAHTFFPRLREWGAAACTLHGRTRAQRYTRLADWDYIKQCVEVVDDAIPVIGNGDIFSYRGACEF
jgi:hypothetical protein